MATKRPLSLSLPLLWLSNGPPPSARLKKSPDPSPPPLPPPPLFVQALRDAIRRERKDGGGGDSLSLFGERRGGSLLPQPPLLRTLPKKALLSLAGAGEGWRKGRSQSLRIWPAEEWGGWGGAVCVVVIAFAQGGGGGRGGDLRDKPKTENALFPLMCCKILTYKNSFYGYLKNIFIFLVFLGTEVKGQYREVGSCGMTFSPFLPSSLPHS